LIQADSGVLPDFHLTKQPRAPRALETADLQLRCFPGPRTVIGIGQAVSS